MANIKVSEMTEATSFDDGDYTMIVQANQNKKISKENIFSNLEDEISDNADNITTINNNIGDLSDLETSDKTSVVNAINSIFPKLVEDGEAVPSGRIVDNKIEYVQRFNCGNAPAKNGQTTFNTQLSGVAITKIEGKLQDSSNEWFWTMPNPYLRIRYRYSNGTIYFNENNYESLSTYKIILDVYFTNN